MRLPLPCRWLAIGVFYVLMLGGLTLLHRLGTDAYCKSQVPLRIHFSGEPTSYQLHAQVDLRILAGGANLEPSYSFYNPILLSVVRDIYDNEKRLAKVLPPSERKFADVFYRSSLCAKDREDAVAVVRKIVEGAGFSFKVSLPL